MLSSGPPRSPQRSRSIHRTLGIVTVLFTLLLALTGIILNHTESLGLDSTNIRWQPLMRWYGIKVPTPVSYPVNDRWITQLGARIFLDSVEIHQCEQQIAGAVELPDDKVAIAFTNQLLLTTAHGEIIEIFGDNLQMPSDISGLGLDEEQRLCLRTIANTRIFDPDTIALTTATGEITWSVASMPDDTLIAELTSQYGGEGLPLERIVLDLHSGRLFGKYGVYVFDAVAIGVMVLAFTGIWLYVKSRRRPTTNTR